MALYIDKIKEWPNPDTRAVFVSEHEPRNDEKRKPDIVWATLDKHGFVSLNGACSVSFVERIAAAFRPLVNPKQGEERAGWAVAQETKPTG